MSNNPTIHKESSLSGNSRFYYLTENVLSFIFILVTTISLGPDRHNHISGYGNSWLNVAHVEAQSDAMHQKLQYYEQQVREQSGHGGLW
jgi:hypothetical protein